MSNVPTQPVQLLRRGSVPAWFLYVLSALVIPVWFLMGASLSGKNHFGQGLEGSLYSKISWLIHMMSLLGFVLAPFLSSRPISQKAVLAALALVAFFAIEFVCFVFIAFGMFPD